MDDAQRQRGPPGAASTGSSARSRAPAASTGPRTLMRHETNVEHEAEEHRLVLHRRDLRQRGRASSTSTTASSGDDPFFLYLAYTAPHWPLHAHEEDIAPTPAASTPAGTSCARSGWSGSSRRASSTRRGRSRRATSASRRGRRSSTASGRPPAWRRTPPRSTGWTRGSAGSSTSSSASGRLDNTLVVFLSDNGGCAEEMPPEEGAREFVTAFVPLQETTREGDPVVPGNDPALRPGPESTLHVLRPVVGQPLQHAVPRVQALGARGRDLHSVHRPLAGGAADRRVAVPGPEPARRRAAHHRRRGPRRLPDAARRPRRAGRGGREPAVRAPRRARRRRARPLLGARGQLRRTPWPLEAGPRSTAARGSSTTSRPTAPSWTTWRRRTRTSWRPSTDAWQSWADRCGVIPREKVLELYAARGHGLPEE